MAETLAGHKAHCPHCRAEITRTGAPLCSRFYELAAEERAEQAVREQLGIGEQ